MVSFRQRKKKRKKMKPTRQTNITPLRIVHAEYFLIDLIRKRKKITKQVNESCKQTFYVRINELGEIEIVTRSGYAVCFFNICM